MGWFNKEKDIAESETQTLKKCWKLVLVKEVNSAMSEYFLCKYHLGGFTKRGRKEKEERFERSKLNLVSKVEYFYPELKDKKFYWSRIRTQYCNHYLIREEDDE